MNTKRPCSNFRIAKYAHCSIHRCHRSTLVFAWPMRLNDSTMERVSLIQAAGKNTAFDEERSPLGVSHDFVATAPDVNSYERVSYTKFRQKDRAIITLLPIVKSSTRVKKTIVKKKKKKEREREREREKEGRKMRDRYERVVSSINFVLYFFIYLYIFFIFFIFFQP